MFDLLLAKLRREKANKTGVMRKLISRTIAAGENLTSITWTLDDAGEALSLLEAKFVIDVPANTTPVGTSVWLYLTVNDKNTAYQTQDADNATNAMVGCFRALYGAMRIAAIVFPGKCVHFNSEFLYSDGTSRSAGFRPQRLAGAISNINKMVLSTGSGNFPVGTVIEIYGRRE